MRTLELAGKTQTVLGTIGGEDLGITLPHEHLIVDASSILKEPSDYRERQLKHQSVTLENVGNIRYNPRANLDSLRMLDEAKIIKEVLIYKGAGGNTIVDCTPIDLGRNPDGLVRIAKATGINVIMGTGYYFDAAKDPTMDRRSVEDIAEEVVKNITEGIGPSKVRAGIIGEIGISYPMLPNQKKILRAAAKAQRLTGAPISIHPGLGECSALEIIELLDDAGADISHTIMCHIDMSVRQPNTRRELAKTGCYLEYDHLGREEYYHPHAWTMDLPDDLRRVDEIMELISWGYLNQILISQDIATKGSRSSYGGWGYEHILRDFVPLMKRRGVSEDEVNTILVNNPKKAIPFA